VGTTESVNPRVVFDTNTVLSALLFPRGRLAWLRWHWRDGECVPLISKSSAAELHRVLLYPKFSLDSDVRLELIGEYLPYCEIVEVAQKCNQRSRDPYDQPFLDLAFCGGAEVLVTGDDDLLVLAESTPFKIKSPEDYRAGLRKS
jgi:putative PIN family toxin of toxin-antitoxin system